MFCCYVILLISESLTSLPLLSTFQSSPLLASCIISIVMVVLILMGLGQGEIVHAILFRLNIGCSLYQYHNIVIDSCMCFKGIKRKN